MIKKFVQRLDENRERLLSIFKEKHPESYEDIVRAVVSILHNPKEHSSPDPTRIHTIDDGDWQGTYVYIIAADGYQPSRYWGVTVGYGSCSGCDTLQAIRDYEDELPNDEQVQSYMQLAINIVQSLRPIHVPWGNEDDGVEEWEELNK